MPETSQAIIAYSVILLIAGVAKYYFDKKKHNEEISRIDALPEERRQIELSRLIAKKDDYKTNHILHFFVSIFTFSLWIIPWILIASLNSTKRKAIDRLINRV